MRASTILATLLLLHDGNCDSVESCPEACKELQKALPDGLVQPVARPNAYFAVQLQSVPGACYIYPTVAEEVALVIKTASKYRCEFAMKSGGSQVYGANNLAGGIVLNLDAFNNVTLSEDRTYALVGAGNTWGDVYGKLDPLNYTVIGGRDTTVGVGGLLLGGGISFFSGTYGLACDNVLAYEVVLADGTITTITQYNYPDLYRALRGGGNNFAVVTQFHLVAYEYDLIQGGVEVYTDSNATQVAILSAFTYFVHNGQESPGTDMILFLAWINGTLTWLTNLSYSRPSPSVTTLAAYQRFYTQQLNSSRTLSVRSIGNQSHFAAAVASGEPFGYREQFYTGTYQVDEQFLNDLCNAFRKTVARIHAALNGTAELFDLSPTIDPVTKNILKAESQRGGNVLGLDPDGPPVVIILLSWPWSDPQHDALFNGGMNEVVQIANKLAKECGLYSDYIYMNYASPGSTVIEGYGEDNVRFLHGVSARYDPNRVFQKLVPGGFKLPSIR